MLPILLLWHFMCVSVICTISVTQDEDIFILINPWRRIEQRMQLLIS